MFDYIKQQIQTKTFLGQWRENTNNGGIVERRVVSECNCKLDNLNEIMNMLQQITRRIEKIETLFVEKQ